MTLVERILAIDAALADADVPHAFGGALALAWCTQRARATIDVDVNIFVTPEQAEVALGALPDGVAITDADRDRIACDGQTRLWWDGTPVDVFFDTAPFHRAVARRVQHEDFAGRRVPFLGCDDLAVFKAFFDRTKDWADIEEMLAAGTLDVAQVLGILVEHLGGEDHRIARLRALA